MLKHGRALLEGAEGPQVLEQELGLEPRVVLKPGRAPPEGDEVPQVRSVAVVNEAESQMLEQALGLGPRVALKREWQMSLEQEVPGLHDEV